MRIDARRLHQLERRRNEHSADADRGRTGSNWSQSLPTPLLIGRTHGLRDCNGSPEFGIRRQKRSRIDCEALNVSPDVYVHNGTTGCAWYRSCHRVDTIGPKAQTVAVQPELIEEAASLIRGASSIAALTGAGISTESGIPDYRGPGGLWETRDLPTISDYLENIETRRSYWQRRLADYPGLAAREPNAGHRALMTLEERGILLAIITQNIDGLHQKAGNTPARVLELHGNVRELRCVENGHIWTADHVRDRLVAGEDDPRCEICGSILRTGTVLFGDPLPQQTLQAAVRVSQLCDVMLVVGSSLVVNPAARLPRIAREHGASLIVINRTPTPLDGEADVLIEGEAGPTLASIVTRLDAVRSEDQRL